MVPSEKLTHNESNPPAKKMVKKLTGYEKDLVSSAFLTGGEDGNWDDDDLTVGSADNRSLESQGSYGSYGSLKSVISVVETQSTQGGEKVKTFEVDMCAKGGVIVRQRLTLRTLIDNIESRARENLLPPLYVPDMYDLPSKMVSWNGKNNFKPSKKMLERQRRQEALMSKISGNTKNKSIEKLGEDLEEGSVDDGPDDSLDGSQGGGSLAGSSVGGLAKGRLSPAWATSSSSQPKSKPRWSRAKWKPARAPAAAPGPPAFRRGPLA